MKNILLLVLLSFSLTCFGQVKTDAELTTQSNVIRDEPNPNGNTRARIAAMYKAIIDSKVNVSESQYVILSGTNTYTGSLSPAIASYTTGLKIWANFTNVNSGVSTVNLNSLGAIQIVKDVSTPVSSGDLVGIKNLVYDGTNFRVVGPVTGGGGGVTTVSGTTDRITSTGGSTPAINISATFEGLLGKVANPLSQFAPTTSAQLAGVITDEVGTGAVPLQSYVDAADALKANKKVTYNDQTTNYTIQASDANTVVIRMDSPTGLTVNIPNDATLHFDEGTVIGFIQEDAGAITFNAISPGNLENTAGDNLSHGENNWVFLVKKDNVNGWYLSNGSGSSGSSTFAGLTDGPGSFSGKTLNYVRVNAGESALEYRTSSQVRTDIGAGTGNGDALVANPLSQFSSTTSAQLRSTLSDETGSGLAYFADGALGTPSSGVGTNITGIVGTNVTNTPAGGIAATTSQAAINELDSEKRSLINSSVALTDASTIDLTATKHTLASSSSTRTFTISYTGDDIITELTLSTTSATYTFPATSLCVSEGIATGDNTCPLVGTSGDKYLISIKKIGSNYYVVAKNFGQ